MSEISFDNSDEWKSMPVNRPKLVKNITETYPDIAEALVVESLQNAIDAMAKKVHIICDQNQRIFNIEDDGGGMSEIVFLQDYHGIAYSSKDHRKTIGFRGFGNKVYIASGNYVVTETRSETFWGSSIWNLEKGFKITDRPRTLEHNGTVVKIYELLDEVANQLSTNQIRAIVQRHYNSKLRDVQVYVNNETLPIPKKQYVLVHRKKIDITIPNIPEARTVGYIGYSKSDLSIEDQRICVAVHGKMIERTLFECSVPKSLRNERITGEISADFLAQSETTQRHGFRDTQLRQLAWGEMRKTLNVWLSQIEKIEQEELTQEEKRFLGKITKTVWRILKQIPELDLGVGRARSKKESNVELFATKTEPPKETLESKERSKAERTPPKGSRSHRGLSIGFIDDPNEKEIVFQARIFRINRMHPAYLVAKREKQTREYHVMKCLLNKLIELNPPKGDNMIQTISELQDKFFRSWAKEYM
jgi:hypothetical protein